MRFRQWTLLGCALALGAAGAAAAQPAASPATVANAPAAPLPALRQRAEQIVAMINGQADPNQIMDPRFLAEHPAEEVRRLGARIRGRLGNAIAVSSMDAVSPHRANLVIAFANARFPLEITIQREAPHLVTELMFGD
jgi:hypothetical protein